MKITDEDREAAAELVEILTDGRGDQLTRNAVAIYLAAHRAKATRNVGRCGAAQPTLGWPADGPCELPAGHLGWHRHGATEWGAR